MSNIRFNNFALLLVLVCTACKQQQIEVVPDEVTALLQAAENGDAQSQYELGLAFHRGELVQQDYNKAGRWIRTAASQNHLEAQVFLANNLINGTYTDAATGEEGGWAAGFIWMKRAADQGSAEAQLQVGHMYSKGKGTIANAKLGFEYVRRANEQEHPQAVFLLGWLYERGEGCTQDLKQAVAQYHKAGKMRVPEAQYYLGYLYSIGKHVPEDLIVAHRYFQGAKRNGDSRAEKALLELEKRMTPEQLSKAAF